PPWSSLLPDPLTQSKVRQSRDACATRKRIRRPRGGDELLPRQFHRGLMAAGKGIQPSADPFRKTSEIRHEIISETSKGDLRRGDDKEDAQEQQVHQINKNEGKKCAVIAEVRLVFRNHPAGEGKMESPGNTENGVEQLAIGCDIDE